MSILLLPVVVAWLGSHGGANATGCDANPVTWGFTMPNWEAGHCDGYRSLTVSFSAEDNCGQSIMTNPVAFHVRDTTSPEITSGAIEKTVELVGGNDDALVAAVADGTHGGAEALDAVSDVSWTWDYSDGDGHCVAVGPAGCAIKRCAVLYTASDACGNSAGAISGNITLTDTNAPVIQTLPSALMVEYDNTVNSNQVVEWLESHGSAAVIDVAGSDVTWSWEATSQPLEDDTVIGPLRFRLPKDTAIEGIDATPDILSTVRFIATDGCGNSIPVEATATIMNSNQAMKQPAQDVTVESNGEHNVDDLNLWINAHGNAQLDPSIDTAQILWTEMMNGIGFEKIDETASCQDSFIAFTFTVNSPLWIEPISTKASFFIRDRTPPVVRSAENLISNEETDFETWLSDHGGARAVDVVSVDLVWSHSDVVFSRDLEDDVCIEKSATITFTVADQCHNEAHTVAKFSLRDVVAPSIDHQAADLSVTQSEAGYSAELQQWLDTHGGATIFDQDVMEPHGVTWTHSDVQFVPIDPESECSDRHAVVTFTATDSCSNANSTVAQFAVLDKTPPSFSATPVDGRVEADGSDGSSALSLWIQKQEAANLNDGAESTASWTHNVSAITRTQSEDEGTCADATASVTFMGTDACGNLLSYVVTFHITDSKAPIIVTPTSDIRVEKNADAGVNTAQLNEWLNQHGGAEVVDTAGSGVVWTHSEPVFEQVHPESSCTDAVAHIIFTATDGCGNIVQLQSSFVIVDSSPAALITPPSDLSVEIAQSADVNTQQINEWLSRYGGATADQEVTWTHGTVNFEASAEQCASSHAVVVFEATDSCGNVLKSNASIYRVDTTGPVISIEAQPVVVDDSVAALADINTWAGNAGGAVATDALSGPVDWSYSIGEFTMDGENTPCGNRHALVTFTATDKCGNEMAVTTTAHIKDQIAPLISTASADAVVEGADDMAFKGLLNSTGFNEWVANHGGAAASDSISAVSWSHEAPSELSFALPTTAVASCRSKTTEVVFLATDACGNVAKTAATYSVVDETAPDIVTAPRSPILEGNGHVHIAELTEWLENGGYGSATDGTSDAIRWTHNPSPIEWKSEGTRRYVEVTFVATDDCGNSKTAEAVFSVEDTTAPIIRSPAINVSVELGTTMTANDLELWLADGGAASAADRGFDNYQCMIEIQRKRRRSVAGGRDRRQENCFCNDYDEPVCGNGVDFINRCWAFCASIFEVTDGHCTVESIATTNPSAEPTTMPTESPPIACADTKESCSVWSIAGFCDEASTYYAFMSTNCPRSCNFCQSAAAPTDPVDSRAPSSAPTYTSRTCQELGREVYSANTGSPNVCSFSDTSWLSVGPSLGCLHDASHDAATTFCASYGGRLCTTKELSDDVARGSGCNGDTRMTWASDECENGHMIHPGSTRLQNQPECGSSNAVSSVRCCADLADSTLAPASSVPTTSPSGAPHTTLPSGAPHTTLPTVFPTAIPTVFPTASPTASSTTTTTTVTTTTTTVESLNIVAYPNTLSSMAQEVLVTLAWNTKIEGNLTVKPSLRLVDPLSLADGAEERYSSPTVIYQAAELLPSRHGTIQVTFSMKSTEPRVAGVYKLYVYSVQKGGTWAERLDSDGVTIYIGDTNAPTLSPSPLPTLSPSTSFPTASPVSSTSTTTTVTSSSTTTVPVEQLQIVGIPSILSDSAKSLSVILRWATETTDVTIGIKATLKLQEPLEVIETDRSTSKSEIDKGFIPFVSSSGVMQFTFGRINNETLPHGRYRLYVYSHRMGDTWADRLAAVNSDIWVGDSTTMAPPTTLGSIVTYASSSTIRATTTALSGPVATEASHRDPCPSDIIERFEVHPDQLMSKKSMFILETYIALSHAECANMCVKYGLECVSFLRNINTNECNLKSKAPGQEGIILKLNTRFFSGVRTVFDCGLSELEDAPKSTATMPTTTTSSITEPVNDKNDDNINCPPYIDRFQAVPDTRLTSALSNRIVAMGPLGTDMETAVANCAMSCMTYQDEDCTVFEIRSTDWACTLRRDTDYDNRRSTTKFTSYLRDMSACSGLPDTISAPTNAIMTSPPSVIQSTSAPQSSSAPLAPSQSIPPSEAGEEPVTTPSTGVIYATAGHCACNANHFNPVCAAGTNFFNPCYAFCHMHFEFTNGDCSSPASTVVTTLRPTTTSSPTTTLSSETTSPPSVEDADKCSCDLKVFSPVCSDGVRTYHSICFALCDGAGTISAGPCVSTTSTTTETVTTVTSTSMSSTSRTSTSQTSTTTTFTSTTATVTSTSTTTVITEAPECFCDPTYDPVCARDIVTYQNPCFALCVGDSDYEFGACGSCGDLDWSFSQPDGMSTQEILTQMPLTECESRTVPFVFTVIDPSGNSATTSSFVSFVDTTSPQIDVAASDITVESHGVEAVVNNPEVVAWLDNVGGASATDAAGSITWTHQAITFDRLDEYSGGDDCTDSFAHVTFIATDNCGLKTRTRATVTSMDRTAPTVVNPAKPLVVERSLGPTGVTESINIWLSMQGGAVAHDNVSVILSWAHSDVALERIYDNQCQDERDEVIFTATDDCGNELSFSSTVEVTDSEAPVFSTLPTNRTVHATSEGITAEYQSWLDAHGDAVALDLVTSSADLSWSYEASGFSATDAFETGTDCLNQRSIVTFSVEDECGNHAEIVAQFNIDDVEHAVITNEAVDLTVEIDTSNTYLTSIENWLAAHAQAAAVDDLSETLDWHYIRQQYVPEFPDHYPTSDGTGTQVVRFIAEDYCGNQVSTTALLTVQDTTAPTIVEEATSLSVEDSSANSAAFEEWLLSHGGAVASDSCGILTWSFPATSLQASTVDANIQCKDTSLSVNFSVTDLAGNIASTVASFHVVDTTSPTITSEASGVFIESLGVDGNTEAIRSFIDEHAGAQVSDLRNDVTWSTTPVSFVKLHPDNSCNNRTAEVTFTATDGCNNSAETVTTFTIVDTTAPVVIQNANNIRVAADGQGNSADLQAWLDTHGGAEVTDLETESLTWTHTTVEFVEVSTENSCGDRFADIVFTATDDCGNSVSSAARFSITDAQPPAITKPASNVTVSDESGTVLIGTGTVVPLDNENTATLNQWLATHAGAKAFDAASGENLAWDFTIPSFSALVPDSQCTDRYIDIAFAATDACGNTATTTGRFAVIDTNVPSIFSHALPASAEMKDEDTPRKIDAWLDRHGNAVALDSGSSDGITWTHRRPKFNVMNTDSMCKNEVATVDFTATDTCGNSATSTAIFTLIDTTPPMIQQPASDIIIQTDDNSNVDEVHTWLQSHGGATATDDANDVVWTYTQPSFTLHHPSSACPDKTASVLFTATDGCGNVATSSASLSIVDGVDPVVVSAALDQSVNTDGVGNVDDLQNWLVTQGGAYANKMLTWSFQDPQFDITTCSGRSAQVKFIGKDRCDRTVETEATFTIKEVLPPSLSQEAKDAEVQADYSGNGADLQNWLNDHGGAVAAGTGTGLEWSYEFVNEGWTHEETEGRCYANKFRVVKFVATDSCGVNVTSTATFRVVDQKPPQISCNSGFEIRCDHRCRDNVVFDEFLNNQGHLCVDDISGYTVSHNFNRSAAENFMLDLCGTTGTVTFTFTDGCGNIAEETVSYTINEETPQCDACESGSPTSFDTLQFMWIAGPEAATETAISLSVDRGTVSADVPTTRIRSGDTFEVTLTPDTLGGTANSLSVYVGASGIEIGLDCQSQEMALRTMFDLGSDIGSMQLIGFHKVDGSNSDSCGEKDKCDPDLCTDLDVCVDGQYSLEYLEVMYLGWNPEGGVSTDQHSLPSTAVGVTEPGPMGKSPIKWYLSKFDQTDTDLDNVRIGQQIKFTGYAKNPGDPIRFPGFLNFRLDNAAHKVKFDTACKGGMHFRVGDRFGSILITGYKSTKAKQCHIAFQPSDFVSDEQSAAAFQDDINPTTSEDSTGAIVLGAGFGLVALVVLSATVVLNNKRTSDQQLDDTTDNSSEVSFGNSALSMQSATTMSSFTQPDDNSATAMDLINSHHYDVSVFSPDDFDTQSQAESMAWDTHCKDAPDRGVSILSSERPTTFSMNSDGTFVPSDSSGLDSRNPSNTSLSSTA